jgi:hypothetical protein
MSVSSPRSVTPFSAKKRAWTRNVRRVNGVDIDVHSALAYIAAEMVSTGGAATPNRRFKGFKRYLEFEHRLRSFHTDEIHELWHGSDLCSTEPDEPCPVCTSPRYGRSAGSVRSRSPSPRRALPAYNSNSSPAQSVGR